MENKSEYSIGKKRWAIAEGYIPAKSHYADPNDKHDMTSHEAICILNASFRDANVELMIYFTDRDPVGPYRFHIKARRSFHIRLNDLTTPEIIPKDTEFSSVIESDVPIVVQHSRLDSRQAENALMTTVAYSE